MPPLSLNQPEAAPQALPAVVHQSNQDTDELNCLRHATVIMRLASSGEGFLARKPQLSGCG